MKLYFYLASIAGIYLSMTILTAIVEFGIWNQTPLQYEMIGTIAGVFVLLLGLISIGYFNSKFAPMDKFKQSLNAHCLFVLIMFVGDVLYSESSILIIVLRNLGYLVALQLGAYIFKRFNPELSKIPNYKM